MAERDKVIEIFRELAGERASKLEGGHYPADINDRITVALNAGERYSRDIVDLDQIGFHLVDWNHDAAFIVAVMLFPERFTDEEIQDGVEEFLVHVPAHVIEAARLGGYPTENIFNQPNQNSEL